MKYSQILKLQLPYILILISIYLILYLLNPIITVFGYILLSSLAIFLFTPFIVFKSVGKKFSPNVKVYLQLFALNLIVGIVTLLGLFLLILPGLFAMTKFTFSTQELLLKKKGIKESLLGSYDKIKGILFWKILGIDLGAILLNFILAIFGIAQIFTSVVQVVFLSYITYLYSKTKRR